MKDLFELAISFSGLLVALVALGVGGRAAKEANRLSADLHRIEAERWQAETSDRTVQAHWANAPRDGGWVWGLVVTNTHARQVTDVEIEVWSKKGSGSVQRTARAAVLPPGEWFIEDASRPVTPLPEGVQPLTHAKNYRVGQIGFRSPDGERRTVGAG